MSEGLGNIFDAVDEGEGPRGEDLFHTIEVPRSALGHPTGQLVPVPEKIVHAGERVARVTDTDREPGWLHLSLGEDVPEGASLRLRGQGEPKEDGRPGDLILKVRFNDDAEVRLPPVPAMVASPPRNVAVAGDNRPILIGFALVAVLGIVLAILMS